MPWLSKERGGLIRKTCGEIYIYIFLKDVRNYNIVYINIIDDM